MSRLFKCDRCGKLFDEKHIADGAHVYEITRYLEHQGDIIHREWLCHIDLCPSCQKDLDRFLTECKEETK